MTAGSTTPPAARPPLDGLLEAAPDAIVVVDDLRGTIAWVNRRAEALFGHDRQELLGEAIERLVPGWPRAEDVEGREVTGRRKDGAELPIELRLGPLEADGGRVVIGVLRDLTQRRAAEDRLKAALREKEVLLQEIHHRVKNNLQVTSSLLKLQASHVQDRQARELLAESQGRIRSMALVHEKLYRSSDLSHIDLVEYVESLAGLLLHSYGAAARRITLTVHGDPVSLAIDAAVPCGLIVNELVSNCLKHAFPGDRAGTIDIHVRAEPGRRFTVAVRDDGVGLPAELDLDQPATFGLQLVKTLAEQLRADLEVVRGAGTELRLHVREVTP